ncbi:MAG: hypothetical protein ACR2OD_08885 [Gaiellaceae bacterium]
MSDITAETLNALAEKIDSLNLTDMERSVLEQVLARAAACESEVDGFLMVTHELGVSAPRPGTASKLSRALGSLTHDPAFEE